MACKYSNSQPTPSEADVESLLTPRGGRGRSKTKHLEVRFCRFWSESHIFLSCPCPTEQMTPRGAATLSPACSSFRAVSCGERWRTLAWWRSLGHRSWMKEDRRRSYPPYLLPSRSGHQAARSSASVLCAPASAVKIRASGSYFDVRILDDK